MSDFCNNQKHLDVLAAIKDEVPSHTYALIERGFVDISNRLNAFKSLQGPFESKPKHLKHLTNLHADFNAYSQDTYACAIRLYEKIIQDGLFDLDELTPSIATLPAWSNTLQEIVDDKRIIPWHHYNQLLNNKVRHPKGVYNGVKLSDTGWGATSMNERKEQVRTVFAPQYSY